MAGYDLQPGESFVHKHDRVLNGGFGANYTDELILTSHNIVLVKKGVFGNGKGVRVFPLNQVKVFDDHAQVVVGRQRSLYPCIDVYFQNGSERFGFETKKEAIYWAEKIDELITGTRAKSTAPDPTASAMDILGEAMSVTFGTFGFKRKTEVAAADLTVAGDCVSCGAPISGIRGQATVCKYCDSPNQL